MTVSAKIINDDKAANIGYQWRPLKVMAMKISVCESQ